jgi:hypothetical protein
MSGGSSFMVTMPCTCNMSSCFSPVSMVCSMRQLVGWVVLVTSNWVIYSCSHSDTPYMQSIVHHVQDEWQISALLAWIWHALLWWFAECCLESMWASGLGHIHSDLLAEEKS